MTIVNTASVSSNGRYLTRCVLVLSATDTTDINLHSKGVRCHRPITDDRCSSLYLIAARSPQISMLPLGIEP